MLHIRHLIVIPVERREESGESAVISDDMEEFAVTKEEWFRRYLELPNGIPSHDTFNRAYQLLDPFAFQECLIRWTQGVREMISGETVAIDGKAQRRARNRNANLRYIVNAWAGENRLTAVSLPFLPFRNSGSSFFDQGRPSRISPADMGSISPCHHHVSSALV